MHLSLYTFKFFEKILNHVKSLWDYMFTWIKLFCFCEKFHNFRTKGIPFLFVSIQEKGSIYIGKNFSMNNGMSGNQIGFGKTPCVLQAIKGKIQIGDNVGISQTTIIALADVTIGNNVFLGSGVKIYTSDFHSTDYKSRRDKIADVKNTKCAPVIIGDDCFIGAGATILKGVTIGPRSIIGAGSIVTKDVPPDELWAGNPAKYIKKCS